MYIINQDLLITCLFSCSILPEYVFILYLTLVSHHIVLCSLPTLFSRLLWEKISAFSTFKKHQYNINLAAQALWIKSYGSILRDLLIGTRTYT